MLSNIGKWIKYYRTDKNLSLRALSEMAKVSAASISKYENNISVPSDEILEKISSALGVEKEDLLSDHEPVLKGDRFDSERSPAIILKGPVTDIAIIVKTNMNEEMSDNEKGKSFYEFESPIAKEVIMDFLRENRDEIIDRLESRLKSEIEKMFSKAKRRGIKQDDASNESDK